VLYNAYYHAGYNWQILKHGRPADSWFVIGTTNCTAARKLVKNLIKHTETELAVCALDQTEYSLKVSCNLSKNCEKICGKQMYHFFSEYGVYRTILVLCFVRVQLTPPQCFFANKDN